MKQVMNVVLAVVASIACFADAAQLTKKNWIQAVKGKYVFINFRSTDCEHCKKLAPDWETLTTENRLSASKLVAEVDCTSERQLCEFFDVHKYPTLKFGQASTHNLKDYVGAMNLNAFRQFVKEKVGPSCGPDHVKLCSKDQKAMLDKFQKMPPSVLASQIKEKEKFWAEQLEHWKMFVDNLNAQGQQPDQAAYEKEGEKMNAAWEEVEASGLELMKEVRASWKGWEHAENSRLEEL